VWQKTIIGSEMRAASWICAPTVNSPALQNTGADPLALVEDLPGVQQRVEIIKALYRGQILVWMNRPPFTHKEVDDLFRIMRQLTQRGVSIVFIAHKARKSLAIADRITVMRRGKVIVTHACRD
jgi:simple sugar transport system ATP-binding protein